MSQSNVLAPLSDEFVLQVGQDEAGHWLVQEVHGLMEGRFVSFQAALSFARSERLVYPGARVALVSHALVPQISFAPLSNEDRAWPRAA